MLQKINLVNQARQEHGLNQALKALSLTKSTWYYWQQKKQGLREKYSHLKDDLLAVAKDHPEYGYRRATAELRDKYGLKINHKLVAKLNQCWDLPIIRKVKKPKPNIVTRIIKQAKDKANLVAQIENPVLYQICYTDFSEIPYAQGAKKAQFMPILEHVSKHVPGWVVSEHDNAQAALIAWSEAKTGIKKIGFSIKGLILHQDQDPVYTSHAWSRQIVIKDQARLSFTKAGARENPVMESFFGRFKTENKSLFLDCQTIEELRQLIKERILYYNTIRRHSSLGQISPIKFIKNYRQTPYQK
jgi:putative transposase